MNAGREMDALIAEKVFGWIWKQGAHRDITSIPPDKQLHLLEPDDDIADQVPGEFTSIGDWPPQDGRIIWSHLPNYSTDIAAAWELIERHPHYVYLVRSNDNGRFGFKDHMTWRCRFYAPQSFEVEADSAPLAICRAALTAIEKQQIESQIDSHPKEKG